VTETACPRHPWRGANECPSCTLARLRASSADAADVAAVPRVLPTFDELRQAASETGDPARPAAPTPVRVAVTAAALALAIGMLALAVSLGYVP
jgi:hypothetical protein